MIGTTHVLNASDGIGTSRGYGVITSNGDLITVQAFGVALCQRPTGRRKFRGYCLQRDKLPEYAWVNTKPMAFEGRGGWDRDSLTLCEWK